MTKQEFADLKPGDLVTPIGNSKYRGVQMEVIDKNERRVKVFGNYGHYSYTMLLKIS